MDPSEAESDENFSSSAAVEPSGHRHGVGEGGPGRWPLRSAAQTSRSPPNGKAGATFIPSSALATGAATFLK